MFGLSSTIQHFHFYGFILGSIPFRAGGARPIGTQRAGRPSPGQSLGVWGGARGVLGRTRGSAGSMGAPWDIFGNPVGDLGVLGVHGGPQGSLEDFWEGGWARGTRSSNLIKGLVA